MSDISTHAADRRRGDSVVLVISQKLESMQGEMTEMRSILRELTTAVTKMAIVEERQSQATVDLNRAFREIDKCTSRNEIYHANEMADYKLLQLRIAALELQSPATKQTNTWVVNALVGTVVIVMMFIATKVGLT